jgi:hypothetical protein
MGASGLPELRRNLVLAARVGADSIIDTAFRVLDLGHKGSGC